MTVPVHTFSTCFVQISHTSPTGLAVVTGCTIRHIHDCLVGTFSLDARHHATKPNNFSLKIDKLTDSMLRKGPREFLPSFKAAILTTFYSLSKHQDLGTHSFINSIAESVVLMHCFAALDTSASGLNISHTVLARVFPRFSRVLHARYFAYIRQPSLAIVSHLLVRYYTDTRLAIEMAAL